MLTLASGDPGAFDNGERETWRSTHADLAERQAGSVAIRKFNVKGLCIPFIVALLDGRNNPFYHC